MTQLKAIKLDEQTTIFVEVDKEVETPEIIVVEPDGSEESVPITRGPIKPDDVQQYIADGVVSLGNTIESYTNYVLNALRQVAAANVEEVTLQFGVEIGGEAGIPYVTKGTAKSNLNVTVKCTFPKDSSSSPK